MTQIQEALRGLADPEYKTFSATLSPTLPPESFLGVRMPALRLYAKSLEKDEKENFLQSLPHTYFDENMLHVVLLCEEKDYAKALERIEAFLPYAKSWALTDTLNPKGLKKHLGEFLPKVKEWISSPEPYTCRFGLCMLMRYYLDDRFTPELLEIAAGVESEEYYVKMMVAWYFATALAKQWEASIPYIEGKKLSPWVHKKAIQKALESFRVTEEQKRYLKSLRNL